MVFAGIYALAFIPTCLIPAHLLNGAGRKLSTAPASAAGGSSNGSDASEPETRPDIAKPAEKTIDPAAGLPAGAVGAQEDSAVSTALKGPSSGAASRRTSRAHGSPTESGVISAVPSRRTTETGSVRVVVDARSVQSMPEIVVVPAAGDGKMLKSPSPDVAVAKQLEHDPPTPAVLLASSHGGDLKAPPAAAAAATAAQETMWEGLKPLLADIYVLTFFFIALLMGIGNGFIGYLFLFLSDLGKFSFAVLCSIALLPPPPPPLLGQGCRPPPPPSLYSCTISSTLIS